MDYIKTLLGIIVIVNPIAIAPIFMGLTEDETPASKNRIALTASLVSALLLAGASLVGEPMLSFFGVSLPSFRVAGGILLLVIAIQMVNARQPRTKYTPGEAEEAANKDNIAVVPLAIPLLAGPGAISTTILYASHADGWFDRLFLILACLTTGFITYLALRLSKNIGRLLGKTGINIVTRLFGLLLASLGVEFIVGGLKVLLPSLTS